jgi:YggT family protein
MHVIGYFIAALAKVIYLALNIYMIIIIVRAILSWVNPDPYNPIVRFLHNVTEPVLYQIRKRLPVSFGGIDLSPIIVIALIYFLQYFLVNGLYSLSGRILSQ